MNDDLDFGDYRGPCRLFPLPGVVLFPHAVLPLHIFEPRYRQMTGDAIDSDGLIAIVQVRPGADWHGPEEPELEQVACLGKIIGHERLPDGRYHLLLVGLRRIRLVRELDSDRLYRQAEVEVLEDLTVVDDDDVRRSSLIGGFREVASRTGCLDDDLDNLLSRPLPLGALTDLIAHALRLPAALKQVLLEDLSPDRRTAGLCEILYQMLGADKPAERPQFPPPFSVN